MVDVFNEYCRLAICEPQQLPCAPQRGQRGVFCIGFFHPPFTKRKRSPRGMAFQDPNAAMVVGAELVKWAKSCGVKSFEEAEKELASRFDEDKG